MLLLSLLLAFLYIPLSKESVSPWVDSPWVESLRVDREEGVIELLFDPSLQRLSPEALDLQSFTARETGGVGKERRALSLPLSPIEPGGMDSGRCSFSAHAPEGEGDATPARCVASESLDLQPENFPILDLEEKASAIPFGCFFSIDEENSLRTYSRLHLYGLEEISEHRAATPSLTSDFERWRNSSNSRV